MGILLCEQNFRDVWRRNKSVRAEIGPILRTHAAKLEVEMRTVCNQQEADADRTSQFTPYML